NHGLRTINGHVVEWPLDWIMQNATATYDALGRLITWSEAGSTTMPAASLTYKYDAASNVRESSAVYHALDGQGIAATGTTSQDFWYTYDSLNRVLVAKGTLSAGAISRGSNGVLLTYDYAGQRASMQDASTTETYTYDN